MIEIIPAIDIIDGKCVRLKQGDYEQKFEYSADPLSVARTFEEAGIRRLHLVDLDGAKAKHVVNIEVLEKIAGNTSLKVDFGGGIKSEDDLKKAFNAGASQVTGGSIAVTDQAVFKRWLRQYGTDKIILGADVKDGKIAVSGWQKQAPVEVETLLDNYVKEGIQYILSTEISKDGMMEGPAFDWYHYLVQRYPEVNFIASGGISSVEDIEKLEEAGVYGVVIGRAYYEGKITMDQLQRFL